MTPLMKLKEWVEQEIAFLGNQHDHKEDKFVASFLKIIVLEKIEQLMPEERNMVVSAWDSSITWVDGEDITGDIYFTQKYGSNGKAD